MVFLSEYRLERNNPVSSRVAAGLHDNLQCDGNLHIASYTCRSHRLLAGYSAKRHHHPDCLHFQPINPLCCPFNVMKSTLLTGKAPLNLIEETQGIFRYLHVSQFSPINLAFTFRIRLAAFILLRYEKQEHEYHAQNKNVHSKSDKSEKRHIIQE